MKRNKFITLFLTALLSLSMVACGTYQTNSGGGSSQSSASSSNGQGAGDEQGVASTVRLFYYVNGVRTPYLNAGDIQAIWRGENSLYNATFDESGKATVYNLDGNYQVCLSGIPDGYTYNPNAPEHKTTNSIRNIEIDLYEVIVPKSKGTHMYNDYIVLNKEVKNEANPVVYRVTLEKESSRVHCQYSPPSKGLYSVESWVDVQNQTIDPNIDVYSGSFAAKYFGYVLEDGGVSQGYTSNFKHVVDILEDEIGNDFSFAVWAGVKNNKYPVNVDFVVQCDGEPPRQRSKAEMVVPKEKLYLQKNYNQTDTTKPLYKFVTADVDGDAGRKLFDGTMYAFNEQTGFYHVYDPKVYKGYSETYTDGTFSQTFADGYGPILYAEITPDKDGLYPFLDFYYPPGTPMPPKPSDGVPMSISNCELMSNELTLAGGKKNYRFFINGWSGLHDSDNFWVEKLTEEQKKEYSKINGYAAYVNNEHCYAVTKELQQFLLEFSQTKEFFADGEGRAEDYGYDALENDQWLFACRYYKKI